MMAELVNLSVYRLYPWRGFHFGIRGVGVEASTVTAGSDMLFGALCQAVLATQGQDRLLTLLGACRTGRPPFLLSSLFPFAGTVMLLPRPMQPLTLPPELIGRGGKKLRKVL